MTLTHHTMPSNTGTRSLIMNNLLINPVTAVELSDILQINESAVRKHLDILEREDLVEFSFKHSAVGRPKKKYQLTQKGREVFPRKHGLLLSLLVNKIIKKHGEQHFQGFTDEIARDIAQQIVLNVDGVTIEDRLKQLVRSLDAFGFVPSLTMKSDRYILELRNCVFEDASSPFKLCVCGMNSDIIRRVIGNFPIVEEKQSEGGRKCRYEILLGGNLSPQRSEAEGHLG